MEWPDRIVVDPEVLAGKPVVWGTRLPRKAFRWTSEGMHEVTELRTENPEIVVPVADLFED